MTSVGSIRGIAVDPDLHNGNDQAAAMIIRVHGDGSYDMRVFSDDPTGSDEFRRHVNFDGSAYDYEAAAKPAADQAAADQAAGQQARESATQTPAGAAAGSGAPAVAPPAFTPPAAPEVQPATGDAQPPASTTPGAGY